MPGKIAISFEDVITEDAELWGDFAKYARLEAHRILIIGEDSGYLLKEAIEYNGLIRDIHYDEAVSMVDFLTYEGEDVIFNENYDKWRTRDPLTWQQAKARICAKKDVALMFEENHLYAAAFSHIPTRLYLVCDDNDKKEITRLTERLKSMNGWFEGYESEFNAHV